MKSHKKSKIFKDFSLIILIQTLNQGCESLKTGVERTRIGVFYLMRKHVEISGPLHLNPSSDASRLTILFISHTELSNIVPGVTAVVMYSMANTAEQCADNLNRNVSPVAIIDIAPARSENNHYNYAFSINRKGILLRIEDYYYPEYDLSKRPLDICFQISGGNEIGFGITSNILKIDRHAIAASLGAKS